MPSSKSRNNKSDAPRSSIPVQHFSLRCDSRPAVTATGRFDEKEEEGEEIADWDHGFELYNRYLGLNSADASQSFQQKQVQSLPRHQRSVAFHDRTSVNRSIDAVSLSRKAYCEQWRQRTAAIQGQQQRLSVAPCVCRALSFRGGKCTSCSSCRDEHNLVSSSLASGLRTLLPPPLLPPESSSLPPSPTPFARSSDTTQEHRIITFGLRGDSYSSLGDFQPEPSFSLQQRHQQPPFTTLHRPSFEQARSNWVSFDDRDPSIPLPPSLSFEHHHHQQDPRPSLLSHRNHSVSSSIEYLASNTALRKRQASIDNCQVQISTNPRWQKQISVQPIVSHLRWSKMTDEKRTSIEVPETPLSFATAKGDDRNTVDERATIPSYPYQQQQRSQDKEGYSHDHSSAGTTDTEANTPTATEDVEGHSGGKVKKDFRFWIIFAALMLIAFIAALDMTMISTALPAIVSALPPSTIAANWVTSAFLLPMVASQPIFGGLSCSVGRKWSINSALIIFLVGSVVCATAKTFLVLVVGRGIQGLGGGGIHSMCEIIMSDLTTLRERGLFFGLIALVFAVAGFAAPVLGGAFSEHSWPWIFWINLPIGALALVLLVIFLNIRVPLLSGREKWQRLDLVGNAVLFGSVTSILIAVTEGGIKYRWSAWQVWVPLIVGLLGMGLFLVIEWVPNRFSRKPVFPLDLFKSRTAAFAYLQTFIHGVIFYGVIYMVPIYFQSIKDRTPLQSAIWSFPLSAPSFPLAMAAGIAISLTGKYKLLIFAGWTLMAAGVGWMTHWHVATSKLEWAFSQVIAGAGLGILFPITLPPIQAALPASRLESATAAYAFTRTFGAVWGITAATTIFSTQAAKNLRPYYAQLNPLGLNDFTVVAFSEHLRSLPEPIQGVVKRVYAKAISDAYWLFVPLAIIGFLTTFGMAELPLPDFIKSEAKLEQGEDALPALARGAEHAVTGARAEVPSTMP